MAAGTADAELPALGPQSCLFALVHLGLGAEPLEARKSIAEPLLPLGSCRQHWCSCLCRLLRWPSSDSGPARMGLHKLGAVTVGTAAALSFRAMALPACWLLSAWFLLLGMACLAHIGSISRIQRPGEPLDGSSVTISTARHQ